MTSTNIYAFKPTFLYIKQHTITGKLYFGKTVKNPEKYLGSGTYWTNHINKHGKEHVVTLWYCLFYDEQECTEFALGFSKQQNIIESTDWANLMFENGINGGAVENNHFKAYNLLPKTKEWKEKRKISYKGRTLNPNIYTEERTNKIKNTAIINSSPTFPCPFCAKLLPSYGGGQKNHIRSCILNTKREIKKYNKRK